MRGRKPKPTQLKVVSGNPGKRPLNKNEPRPVAYLATAPEWMDDMQREYWDHVVDSAPRGLLGTMDMGVVCNYVVAAAMHRKAAEAQSKLDEGKLAPMLTKTPGGMPIQSPYVGIMNKQAQIMIKAAAEMGFTPSSRSRISLDTGGIGTGNAFDGY